MTLNTFVMMIRAQIQWKHDDYKHIQNHLIAKSHKGGDIPHPRPIDCTTLPSCALFLPSSHADYAPAVEPPLQRHVCVVGVEDSLGG